MKEINEVIDNVKIFNSIKRIIFKDKNNFTIISKMMKAKDFRRGIDNETNKGELNNRETMESNS
jgi:predicted ATP-dependent Lon-type protease